ncbi:MAG: DUF4364 family protein [Oscillospiraceae bacterium]|nr:DUF4364 family protein [Oscillospiraceae bacterium]
MERFGFIHDKLEIKFLILFILSRLAEPVDLDTLTDLTLCDDGITYFAFSESVAELLDTEHLRKEEDGRIAITDKGLRNGRATETSIPSSVRHRAEQRAAALARVQRRNTMVKAEANPRIGGGRTVKLSLSDGLGEILGMELYAATEAQAAAMQDGFTKRAEQLYGQIITLLIEEA